MIPVGEKIFLIENHNISDNYTQRQFTQFINHLKDDCGFEEVIREKKCIEICMKCLKIDDRNSNLYKQKDQINYACQCKKDYRTFGRKKIQADKVLVMSLDNFYRIEKNEKLSNCTKDIKEFFGKKISLSNAIQDLDCCPELKDGNSHLNRVKKLCER